MYVLHVCKYFWDTFIIHIYFYFQMKAVTKKKQGNEKETKKKRINYYE